MKKDDLKPLDLDEAFCSTEGIYAAGEEPTPPLPASLVLTGLSEEEDALRYIALRFNNSLRYCDNCEVYYDTDGLQEGEDFCPRCTDWLRPIGTPASKRKHT